MTTNKTQSNDKQGIKQDVLLKSLFLLNVNSTQLKTFTGLAIRAKNLLTKGGAWEEKLWIQKLKTKTPQSGIRNWERITISYDKIDKNFST